MKNIFLFLFLLVYTSCNKQLDIEPQQAISTAVALSNEQGVKTALIGAYDLLSSPNLWGGGTALYSDVYADANNLFLTGSSFNMSQIFNKDIALENSIIENVWIDAYQAINHINNVLNALDVLKEVDQVKVEAEVRFIRAVILFELVNLYAKNWVDGDPTANLGIPLVNLPTTRISDELKVARNSVTEVYQFIEEDLFFAKNNLPESNGFFVNTYVASALLSRIYLMQEKFDLAVGEANRVIQSGLFELLPTHNQVFNQSQNTVEDIFAIQITSRDGLSQLHNFGINQLSFFYSGENEGGTGLIGITETHLEQYEAGDKRADLFYFDKLSETRRTAKWLKNASNDGNVPIIRLAEMYLTRSEGRFRLGDVASATEDVNIIRNRAGLTAISEAKVNLEVILKERQLELAFEGHLYRDTKRNRKSIGNILFDDPRMIYPIPQREIDINPNLDQNEGY